MGALDDIDTKSWINIERYIPIYWKIDSNISEDVIKHLARRVLKAESHLQALSCQPKDTLHICSRLVALET